MLDTLRGLIPDISRLEEHPIVIGEKIVGFHSIIYRAVDVPFGGGCGETLQKSRRIAVAECIERALFLQLKNSPAAPEFLINEYPTTCGFAAGFESEKTKYRAVCEAIERWHWSKWIDEGFFMECVRVDRSQLSEYSRYFYDTFDEVILLKREFGFSDGRLNGHRDLNFQIGVVLGIKDGGVFPGSRVCQQEDDAWSHGLVEAWRHRMIFQHMELTATTPETIVDERIQFFGRAKDIVLEQVRRANRTNWPEPKLRLLKELKVPGAKHYLWRALCHDYIGWDRGEVERFVF